MVLANKSSIKESRATGTTMTKKKKKKKTGLTLPEPINTHPPPTSCSGQEEEEEENLDEPKTPTEKEHRIPSSPPCPAAPRKPAPKKMRFSAASKELDYAAHDLEDFFRKLQESID